MEFCFNGYQQLQKKIISSEICTLCGACEVACPMNAIEITETNNSQVYDCNDIVPECRICYDICPHTGPNIQKVFDEFSTGPSFLPGIGRFYSIKIARSTFGDIRELTGSGGVATSLALCALEEGLVDAVVASETKELGNMKFQLKQKIPPISDFLPSMLSVHFHPAAVAKAFDSLIKGYSGSRVAFVGVPCHMIAMRKLQIFGHKSSDELGPLIGLFCLWSISSLKDLIESLEERGVEKAKIRSIELDSEFNVNIGSNQIKIPTKEIWERVREGCKTCQDLTGLVSDVSVGRVEGVSPDWSVLIIRSKNGEDLVNRAVRGKYIECSEADASVKENLISLSMKKKHFAEEEYKEDIKRGLLTPEAFEVLHDNIAG
ncbi:MAG: Coenzyme F420 hydrogenase/dehydrogenase, beta subunit C-terminal domain [Candidatus Methanosuratincola sp.]